MSVRFRDTLQTTREVLSAQGWFAKLEAATIIRDASGKIHLLLEGHSPGEAEREALHRALSSEERLGSYWSGDIWIPEQKPDAPPAALWTMIREQRRSAPWEAEAGGPKWYLVERHVAKQSWAERRAAQQPPWPLDQVEEGRAPAVVACFSFKGGVGRTTITAATGLVLARHGHRVALADLDLEAPGLAALFLEPGDDHTGVIDYLIEKPVQAGSWVLRESVHALTDPVLLGDQGVTLRLLPVGSVDADYLEKLARVDLQSLAGASLNRVLEDLLRELNAAVPGGLDFILLDARAGFHELGGLALSELAHAAIVLGIHSAQSWAGLEQVIRRVAKPEQEEGLPVVLVHALAPLVGQPGGELERQAFLERAYDLFSEHYYREGEVPDLNDPDQPHVPVVIPWQPELRGNLSLSVESQGVEHLRSLVRRLTDGPYLALAERVCLLLGRTLRKEAA